MTEFKVGDRVRINKKKADGYLQPWRTRFKKGRLGTVVKPLRHSMETQRVRVLWDHAQRAGTLEQDWLLHIDPDDLELA